MDNKLSFSTFQLILESNSKPLVYNYPEEDSFAGIPKEFNHRGSVFKICTELKEDYFWLVAEFGNPEPRREVLLDIKTYEEEKNERKTTQVELTNQSFLLYIFRSKLLYLSRSNHAQLMSKILSKESVDKFLIKRVYGNIHEFIAAIKTVNKIKFTGLNNLFSPNSKQYNALEILTGSSAPESFSLEATYSNKDNKMMNFMRFLDKSRSNFHIDKLVITGFDESNMEKIYNVDTFTSKIPIYCYKNSEGVYDHDMIKKEIMNKIANQ